MGWASLWLLFAHFGPKLQKCVRLQKATFPYAIYENSTWRHFVIRLRKSVQYRVFGEIMAARDSLGDNKLQ